MAFEIVNCMKEHFPALRFIGKRYTNANRDEHGSFGGQWQEWFANHWIDTVMQFNSRIQPDMFGLMTDGANGCGGNNDFSYWIGVFCPPETAAPEGFTYMDLPKSDVGVTWIKGNADNGEIFGAAPHSASYEKIKENGMGGLNLNAGGKDTVVFFERYNDVRFDTKDGQGNVILDYGFYIG